MKNNLLLIAIFIAFTSSAQQGLSVKEAQESLMPRDSSVLIQYIL